MADKELTRLRELADKALAEDNPILFDKLWDGAASPEVVLALINVAEAAERWKHYKHAPADPRDDDLYDALARLSAVMSYEGGRSGRGQRED